MCLVLNIDPGGASIMYVDCMQTVCLYVSSSVFVVCLMQ